MYYKPDSLLNNSPANTVITSDADTFSAHLSTSSASHSLANTVSRFYG